MTISPTELDEQLEELKQCFDLTQSYDNNGQEFLFKVGKRFGAVFNAQSQAWNFAPYTYSGGNNTLLSARSTSQKDRLAGETEESSKSVKPNGTDQIYIKYENWIKYRKNSPRMSTHQNQLLVQLREIV